MSSTLDRKCVICGDGEDVARLELCVICRRDFCTDCSYRSVGRRFCSANCARTFFYGETDDDENFDPDTPVE
jgi:hypothetical protein